MLGSNRSGAGRRPPLNLPPARGIRRILGAGANWRRGGQNPRPQFAPSPWDPLDPSVANLEIRSPLKQRALWHEASGDLPATRQGSGIPPAGWPINDAWLSVALGRPFSSRVAVCHGHWQYAQPPRGCWPWLSWLTATTATSLLVAGVSHVAVAGVENFQKFWQRGPQQPRDCSNSHVSVVAVRGCRQQPQTGRKTATSLLAIVSHQQPRSATQRPPTATWLLKSGLEKCSCRRGNASRLGNRQP